MKVHTSAVELRAQAVKRRRLARFHADMARATGSAPLAAAAVLAYRRAEDMETAAKELTA